MKTNQFALVALLGLFGASVLAQESTPAALMIELDKTVPRKAPALGSQAQLPTPEEWDVIIDKLGSILARAQGTAVEPHALYHMGNALYAVGRVDEARLTYLDVKERFPKHPLVTVTTDPELGSFIDRALSDCAEELTFRQKNMVPTLPRPEIDPTLTATLHFSAGKVKIRFYKNVAQKHRENFLKLARSAAYDLTKIHMVIPGATVSLGDPNSKQPNPAEWGKGGPGYDQDLEFSTVQHRKGTVTMWRIPGQPRSHGSQFQVLLSDQSHLDFVQVPFAQVISGIEILDGVSRQTRNQFQAPVEDCILTGITIEETK